MKRGEVVLEEKVIVGRETVVKEEKEGVELGADEEDEEDEEEEEEGEGEEEREGDGGDKCVVEEKDFVEGAEANEEEKRVRGSEDSIVDACSECWNVESVDGTGGGESSLENKVDEACMSRRLLLHETRAPRISRESHLEPPSPFGNSESDKLV